MVALLSLNETKLENLGLKVMIKEDLCLYPSSLCPEIFSVVRRDIKCRLSSGDLADLQP